MNKRFKYIRVGSLICTIAFSIFIGTTHAAAIPLLGTAWDPGNDTARNGANPAQGEASWSIMGAGIVDVSGLDPHWNNATNMPYTTIAMTDLTGFQANAAENIAAVSIIDIQNVINDAIDVWANVSGFTNLGRIVDAGAGFGAANNAGGQLGDIRIGAIPIVPGGGSVGDFDVLAHAFMPCINGLVCPTDVAGNPLLGSLGGDIHFDSGQTWFISDYDGKGVKGAGQLEENAVDFYVVALHEVGHALGLDHAINNPLSVMTAKYAPNLITLDNDDITGIRAIYNPVPVPAAAWLFGTGLIGLIGVARRKNI